MSDFHLRLRQHMPLRLVINWIKMITILELILFLVGILGVSWLLWNRSNAPFPKDWVVGLLVLSLLAAIASAWVIDVFTKPEISQSPHKTAIRLISALIQIGLLFLVIDVAINLVQATFLSIWYKFPELVATDSMEWLIRFLSTGLWMLNFTLALLFIYVPPLQNQLDAPKSGDSSNLVYTNNIVVPESIEVSKKGKYWVLAIFLMLMGGIILEWQKMLPSAGWGINLGIGSALLAFLTWQFWKKEDLTTLGIVIFPFILPGLIAGLFFSPLLGNFLLTPLLAFSYVIAQLLAMGIWYLNYQFVMKMFTHHFVRGISFLSTQDIHELWKAAECQFLNLSSYDWVLDHATDIVLMKTPHYQTIHHGRSFTNRLVGEPHRNSPLSVQSLQLDENVSAPRFLTAEENSLTMTTKNAFSQTTRKLLPRETRKAMYLAMMQHTEEGEWRFVEDGCEALVFLYWLNSFSSADRILDAILDEALLRQKPELLGFWLQLYNRLIKKVNLSSHHWLRFVSLLEDAQHKDLALPALLGEFKAIIELQVDVDPYLAWLTRQLVLSPTSLKWKIWYQHYVHVLKEGQSLPLTMLELLNAKKWPEILQKAWLQWTLMQGEELSVLLMFFGMRSQEKAPPELQSLLTLETTLGMIPEEDATLIWMELNYF